MTAFMALATLAAAAQAQVAPTPDYTQDAAWLCRPGRADACATDLDVTSIRADGRRKVERFRADRAPAIDCFYVYPTVSRDPTPNSDLTAGDEERAVAASQAARFASQCRVFAPLYRQVTLTALRQVLQGQPVTPDRALALADVTAAWNSYLSRDNGGRGVLLIGHSQGAGLLKQLIAASIETAPVRRNIVAAYLIGANVAVPQGADVGGDLKRMPLCRKTGQFGCVVTYVSFRSDAAPPANTRFGVVPQPGMVAGCTNPAALAGGRATTDAIFERDGPGQGDARQASWSSDGKPIETRFVGVPGLISAECVRAGPASYLSVAVNANPADSRTDVIAGDVVSGGRTLADWGWHLVDMPVAMGDLVRLAGEQGLAWRGITPAKK